MYTHIKEIKQMDIKKVDEIKKKWSIARSFLATGVWDYLRKSKKYRNVFGVQGPC